MQHVLSFVRSGLFLLGFIAVALFIPSVTHAQAAVPSTTYCLGNTSCTSDVSPSPSVTVGPSTGEEPSTGPTDGVDVSLPVTTTSTAPSGGASTAPVESTVPSATTTVAPCATTESTVSVQHRKKHRHKGGWFRKFFRGFLQFLIDLINKLIERLGGNGGSIPSIPTDPCISPTEAPEPTESIEPSESEPSESVAPSEAEPSTGVQPSTGPTGTGGTGTNATVKITFYGAWDNDPPGSRDIAYPQIHDKAGGTGTYADPLTFASPAGDGAYEPGQVIYVPFVEKYFIKEDQCAVSWTAPEGCGAVTMVDLYVGNPSEQEAVVQCENSLTPGGDTEIIVDPPSNLTVSSKKLWDEATGTCFNEN